MIVDQTGGLQMGMEDYRTDETEAEVFHFSRDFSGPVRCWRDLIQRAPVIDQRFPVELIPEPRRKTAISGRQIQKGSGIGY